jgi:hypothetical protein
LDIRFSVRNNAMHYSAQKNRISMLSGAADGPQTATVAFPSQSNCICSAIPGATFEYICNIASNYGWIASENL